MRLQRIVTMLASLTLLGLLNTVASYSREPIANERSILSTDLFTAQAMNKNSLNAGSMNLTESSQSTSGARQVTVGVFTFRYESCKDDGGAFLCHFLVTNKASEDRAINIYSPRSTYVVDSHGDRYFPKEAFFGNSEESGKRSYNHANLPPHTSVKLTLKFDDALPEDEKLGLSIGFTVQGDDEMHRANFMAISVDE